MRSLLLTSLIAVFSSVVIIASPVPDASESGVEFPIPLNGITDFNNFGAYSPPPQIHGGSQAAEEVLGDSQDLSTAWGDPAPKTTPQSDTLSPQQLMFDSSNGNLLAQAANFEDQISSSPTQNPFQKYKDAECGGTNSVCCSGNRIVDPYYDGQPGLPLPCSDKNIKMIDAGYERFLWPSDRRSGRYCLEPVYLTDCNTVFTDYPSNRCFSDCHVPSAQ